MDGQSEIMASENEELSYQSQVMTSTNSDTQNNESQLQPQLSDGQIEACTLQIAPDKNSDEIQTIAENQSIVSDNNNDSSNPQNELNDPAESDDKCAVDEENGTTIEQEIQTQSETVNKQNEPHEKNQENRESQQSQDSLENKKTEENQENTPEDKNKDDDAEESANEQNGSLLVESEKEREKNDDEIDLNQCRVCMSSDNLLDIFRMDEKTSFRVCDLIMKLAPTVKISERDFLPHSICSVCVQRIETAYELRMQCEETDKFLRSKLKRSKRTRRTPSAFVVVDCAVSSSNSDDDDDDAKSDDEFKLSEESEDSSSDTDSDSSYEEKKKRNIRAVKRPAPTVFRKNTNPMPLTKKPRSASGVVYIKADKSDDDSALKKVLPAKKVPAKPVVTNRLLFRCNVCNRPCATAEALAQHRRTHADEKCNICSMIFKQRSALLQHMERHKQPDPERTCRKCLRVFATKLECQRHIQMAHSVTTACSKCKRSFPNKSQLDAHKCSNNDLKPIETSSQRKPDTDTTATGRDLFKSVAPLTTTYWSDSFSD